jgi:hypothetical protein
MMYSFSFFILAVSSSVSYSFIPSVSRGRNAAMISSRSLQMSETPIESEESAADMFASPPVLSTLSESGELEIDFDSLGQRSLMRLRCN